jgi:hypothetical protein
MGAPQRLRDRIAPVRGNLVRNRGRGPMTRAAVAIQSLQPVIDGGPPHQQQRRRRDQEDERKDRKTDRTPDRR